ncbi:MAG: hypothetical protein ACU0DK_08635 [Pseudooceanicola sp.]
MQFDETPIIYRPDGSIDTARYVARGRRMRGEQAHALTSGVFRGLAAAPFRAIRHLLRMRPAPAPERREMVLPGE